MMQPVLVSCMLSTGWLNFLGMCCMPVYLMQSFSHLFDGTLLSGIAQSWLNTSASRSLPLVLFATAQCTM